MERKKILLVLISVICLQLMSLDAAQDLTLVSDATGCLVVKASIDKITDSNLFSKDHNYLLERLALVSDFGTNVFIDGAVGIWQMTESNLNEAKQLLGTLSSVNTTLIGNFQTNFNSLALNDIKKPFYSLLTVGILIEGKSSQPTWRSDVQGQLNYWLTVASNHNTPKFREKFTESAAVLERNKGERNSECLVCNQQPTDLVFVLDSSGSIGVSGWQLQLQFFNKVIDKFEGSINSGDTQVAIVVFTDTITLKRYYSTSSYSIRSSLNSYVFSSGGTNILLGVNTALSIIKGSGSRKDDATVRKLVILLTDGQDSSSLHSASNQLDQLQVNVYAIGVTSGVDTNQLNSIASKPEFVKLYNNFATFEQDIDGIVDASCKTASQLDFHDIQALDTDNNCNYHVCMQKNDVFQKDLTLESMQLHQSRSFELKMEPNKQAVLDMQTEKSTLNVYTAFDYFPSEAIYDEKFVVRPKSATPIIIKPKGNSGMENVASKITVYVASADPECGTACSEDVKTVLTIIDQLKNLLQFNNLKELENNDCIVSEGLLDCTQTDELLQTSLTLKEMQLHQTRHLEMKMKPAQEGFVEISTEDATLYVYTAVDYFPTEEKYDQKIVVQPGSVNLIKIKCKACPTKVDNENVNGDVSFFTTVYAASFDPKCGSSCSEDVNTVLTIFDQSKNLLEVKNLEGLEENKCIASDGLLDCTQIDEMLQASLTLTKMQNHQTRHFEMKMKQSQEGIAEISTENMTLHVYTAMDHFPTEDKYDQKVVVEPGSVNFLKIKCKACPKKVNTDNGDISFFTTVYASSFDPNCGSSCSEDVNTVLTLFDQSKNFLEFKNVEELEENNCIVSEGMLDCTHANEVLQTSLTLKEIQLHQTRHFEMKSKSVQEGVVEISTKDVTLYAYTAVDYIPTEEKYDQKVVIHPGSVKIIKINCKACPTRVDTENEKGNATFFTTFYAASFDPKCGSTCSEDVNAALTIFDQSKNLLEFNDLTELEKNNCLVAEELLDCTRFDGMLATSLTLKEMQLHQTRHFEMKIKPAQEGVLEINTENVTLHVYTAVNYFPTEKKHDKKVVVLPGSAVPLKIKCKGGEKGLDSENGAVSFFTTVYAASFNPKCGKSCSEDVKPRLIFLDSKSSTLFEFSECNTTDKNYCSFDKNILDCTKRHEMFQTSLTMTDFQLHQTRHFEMKVRSDLQAIMEMQPENVTLSVYTAVDYFPAPDKYDQKVVVRPGSLTPIRLIGKEAPQRRNYQSGLEFESKPTTHLQPTNSPSKENDLFHQVKSVKDDVSKKLDYVTDAEEGRDKQKNETVFKVLVCATSFDPECGDSCSEDVNTNLIFLESKSSKLLNFTEPEEGVKEDCEVSDNSLDCSHHEGDLRTNLVLRSLEPHQTRHFELKVKPTQAATLEMRSDNITLYVYAACDYFPTKEKYDQKVIVYPGSMEHLSLKQKDNLEEREFDRYNVLVYADSDDSECGDTCYEDPITAFISLEDVDSSSRRSHSGPSLYVLLLCAVGFHYLFSSTSISVIHDMKF